MNIVLHEPGIALNTGNIGRTCVATDTGLHLIKPYAFKLTEKEIKRSGMDYWYKIRLTEYIDFEDFLSKHSEIYDGLKSGEAPNIFVGEQVAESTVHKKLDDAESCVYLPNADACLPDAAAGLPKASFGAEKAPRLWYATTKARQCYTDVSFGPDDYIMLGNESNGIPEEILKAHPERCIRIPMCGDIRSLNLSNSAAIILYEALRQNGFKNMEKKGNLHRLSWD